MQNATALREASVKTTAKHPAAAAKRPPPPRLRGTADPSGPGRRPPVSDTTTPPTPTGTSGSTTGPCAANPPHTPQIAVGDDG